MNIFEVLKISEEAKTAAVDLLNGIKLQAPQGEIQPAAVVFIKGNEGSVMPLCFDSPQAKSLCHQAAKQMATLLDPELIIFVSEARMLALESTDPKDIPEEIKKFGEIANNPKSIDAILMTFETKYDSWIYRGEISGNRQVKWADKLESTGTVPGTSSGLMQDLMPVKSHLH